MKTMSFSLLVLFALIPGMAAAQYPRNQRIIDGEYFVGSDPGEGNGIHLGGTYGYAVVSIDTMLDVGAGSRLCIRFKSSNGLWSPPRGIMRDSVFSNRNAQLVYAEYFINGDPGFGNGTSLPIASGGVVTLRNPAMHRGDRVSLRVKDSYNRWSPARSIVFRYKEMLRLEYYVTRSTGVETLHDSSATVSGPSDTSSVFTVQQAPLAFPFTYPADTVCVRVITTDGFYSKWTRDPVFWVNPGDGVPSQDDIPIVFALHQNFPNPFNPSSTICYDLPRTTHVTLAVYDLLGREVASLVDEVQEPGYRRAEWIPMSVASGVYFCRLVAGSFAECRKMLLVR